MRYLTAARSELHSVPISPLVEVDRLEFRTVVALNTLQPTALSDQPAQRIHQLSRFKPVVDLERKALAAKVIDYG